MKAAVHAVGRRNVIIRRDVRKHRIQTSHPLTPDIVRGIDLHAPSRRCGIVGKIHIVPDPVDLYAVPCVSAGIARVLPRDDEGGNSQLFHGPFHGEADTVALGRASEQRSAGICTVGCIGRISDPVCKAFIYIPLRLFPADAFRIPGQLCQDLAALRQLPVILSLPHSIRNPDGVHLAIARLH